MARFKNPGGGFTVHLQGKDVRVGEGETVSTDNDEVATALRKYGLKKGDSGERTKVQSWHGDKEKK